MKINDAVRYRIKAICEEFNISLHALAQNAGVPDPTIRQFMQGIHDDIKIKILFKICKGMNMSMIEFFDSKIFDDVDDD